MNLNWLSSNTIYLTIHGSQCYGLNNHLSDVDVKGICIPPQHVEYNLFNRFDQAENNSEIEAKYSHIKNPKNPKFESVIYSLRKFIVLASNVNPNIIELLYTDPQDHFVHTDEMDILLKNRDMFLSSKAKFTFSGYAFAQAAKIERHRKWIVKGELTPPKRSDFNLPEVKSRGIDEVLSYIKSKVEQWNLNQFPLEELQRSDLKETIWELIYHVSNKTVGWDDWPDAYAQGVMHQMKDELDLKDEVVSLINSEREYLKAKNTYESWLRWKAERNPARREMEVKCGYDAKHASHLVRLMRMGIEIMTTGKVIVKRPDAEELLHIKNGGWTYDKVMEHKEEMQSKLDEAYLNNSKLISEGKSPIVKKSVDFEKINDLYHMMVVSHWGK